MSSSCVDTGLLGEKVLLRIQKMTFLKLKGIVFLLFIEGLFGTSCVSSPLFGDIV